MWLALCLLTVGPQAGTAGAGRKRKTRGRQVLRPRDRE